MPKPIRTDSTKERVLAAVAQSPEKSTHRQSMQMGISRRTIRRILHEAKLILHAPFLRKIVCWCWQTVNTVNTKLFVVSIRENARQDTATLKISDFVFGALVLALWLDDFREIFRESKLKCRLHVAKISSKSVEDHESYSESKCSALAVPHPVHQNNVPIIDALKKCGWLLGDFGSFQFPLCTASHVYGYVALYVIRTISAVTSVARSGKMSGGK